MPWGQIRNMRNHIIHAYWQIDFTIVADTITYDLGPLRAAALRLMELLERSAS